MSIAYSDILREDPVFVSTASLMSHGGMLQETMQSTPVSGAGTTRRQYMVGLTLNKPYAIQRWFWQNGATVGTDRIQVGLYRWDEPGHGANREALLIASSPRTLSAGTANLVQYANNGVHMIHITQDLSDTDGDNYTTSSSTFQKGQPHYFVIENTHASNAPAVATITGGTNAPTWTSRATLQFNGTLNRVSLFSCIPDHDYTGTFTVGFGASSGVTSCVLGTHLGLWIDTATNHGIVQTVTATGNSTTPTATLSALGSADNATGMAGGNATGGGITSETGYTELLDRSTTAPAASGWLEFRHDGETTPSATCTSSQWGVIAFELKSKGTGAQIVPAGRYLLSLWLEGNTATLFRTAANRNVPYFIHNGAFFGLQAVTVLDDAAGPEVFVYGFTRRASP